MHACSVLPCVTPGSYRTDASGFRALRPPLPPTISGRTPCHYRDCGGRRCVATATAISTMRARGERTKNRRNSESGGGVVPKNVTGRTGFVTFLGRGRPSHAVATAIHRDDGRAVLHGWLQWREAGRVGGVRRG